MVLGTIALICGAILALTGGGAVEAAPSDSSAHGGERRVIIAFDQAPDNTDLDSIVRQGGRVIRHLRNSNAVVAYLPEERLLAQSALEGVRRIDPDVRVRALDAELDSSWGVSRIAAGDVHALGNTGDGIKVAIMDTGIETSHAELVANYNSSCSYDFVNNDAVPSDDNGHGTHVAGIVAAAMNASGVRGAAPSADLCILKVLDATGSGYASDVIDALSWAQSHGAKVTNSSFGLETNPGLLFETAYDAAESAGLLNIAAAGNTGTCLGTGSNVNYPGAYASVVAVAATDDSDARECFSSTGSAVELAAPGGDILSTYPGGYATTSGTSMASPHVTGVAALMFYIAPTLTAVEARAALAATADDLGTAGRDTRYGYGLVDALAAVTAVTPPDPAVSAVFETPASYTTIDTVAQLSVMVADEYDDPITGLLAEDFVTEFDAAPLAPEDAVWSETGTPGTYSVEIDIDALPADSYPVEVTITDTRDITYSVATEVVISEYLPILESSSFISAASSGAVLVLTISNDDFTAALNSEDTANWIVDVDSTGLTLDNISRDDAQQVSLTFTGTASGGTLTVQALAASLSNDIASNVLEFVVRPGVSGVTAGNKAYDGTTAAVLDVTSAALFGVDPDFSDVTLVTTAAAGVFDDAAAGDDKTVTVSGLTLSGVDASRYTLASVLTTAGIAPIALQVTGALSEEKVYDGTTVASVDFTDASLIGVVGDDVVALDSSGYSADFDTASVGDGKTVFVSGLGLSGADAASYQLDTLELNNGVVVIGPDATLVTFAVTDEGDEQVAIVPTESEIESIIDGVTVTVNLPSGLRIAGPSDWDGSFGLPTEISDPTIPTPARGKRITVAAAIEIGDSDVELALDEPILLTFRRQAGKKVGWSRNGTFHAITSTCSSSTPSLDAGEDCKRDSGRDLLVWTRHFTEFTAYTETSISSGGGGGGGGGGGFIAPLPPEPNFYGEISNVLTASESAAPYRDPASTGDFVPSLALAATPTIDIDKGLVYPAELPGCKAGSLIKGTSSAAVYYCSRDGRRYVFSNERIFRSWFTDFSTVVTLSDSALAAIRLGGNVTYRPGVKMVKVVSDPKTYAVSRNGKLRWVPDEKTAVRLYGSGWSRLIDDLPDAFFNDYSIGEPIPSEVTP